MINNEKIIQEILRSSFTNFLNEVKSWRLSHRDKNCKNMKKFLKSINFYNEDIEKLPPDDELCQIHTTLLFESSFKENKKQRAKWTEDEKKFLLWAVYYYTQIHNTTMEKMVRL